MSDPMAIMHSYLDRRTAVLNNTVVKPRAPTGRERYAVPLVNSDADGFSPIVTSLLDPRRKRTGAIDSLSHAAVPSSSSPRTVDARGTALEARDRNTSERARAQALIASKRLATASITSTAPSDNNWSGMYNARETRDAKSSWQDKRTARHGRERW